MIGGFIISGSSPKQVLMRGRRPLHERRSLQCPQHPRRPMLRIYSGATPIGENNNWQDTNPTAISTTGLDLSP